MRRSTSALENLLRGETLQDERDWKRIDAVLPVLQGAARGLQLRAARSLPVLGQEPGRVVPMLTLTARYKPTEQGAEGAHRGAGDGSGVAAAAAARGSSWRWWWCRAASTRSAHRRREGGQTGVLQLDARKQGAERGTPAHGAAGAFCDGPLPDHPGPVGSGGQPGARPEDSAGHLRSEGSLGAPRPTGLPAGGHRELERLPAMAGASEPSGWRVNGAEQGFSGQAPELPLPGEGEWEAACRARSETPFHFGDTLDPSWANYDATYTYGPGRRNETYPQRPAADRLPWPGEPLGPGGDARPAVRVVRRPVASRPEGAGWPSDGQPWEETGSGSGGASRARTTGCCAAAPGSAIRTAAAPPFRYSSHPAIVNSGIGVRPCCLLPPGSLLGP